MWERRVEGKDFLLQRSEQMHERRSVVKRKIPALPIVKTGEAKLGVIS